MNIVKSIDTLFDELQLAQEALDTLIKTTTKPVFSHTKELALISALQKAIDALVKCLKSNPPEGSDWHREQAHGSGKAWQDFDRLELVNLIHEEARRVIAHDAAFGKDKQCTTP